VSRSHRNSSIPESCTALGLCVALAGAPAAAAAQSIVGTYAASNNLGGTVTLVLRPDGANGLVGSLSGNGSTYALAGKVQGDDATGTLRGNDGAAVFQAHLAGTQLRLRVVELGPNGLPNLSRAYDVVLARQESAPAPSAPSSHAQSAAGASPPGSSASSPQDQQLIRLLTSSAWCTYSFSGGQTYTGGYGGTEHKSRTVFSADGTVTSRNDSELSNSGAPGAVWGNSAKVQTGRWRVRDGVLLLSLDGVQWEATPITVTHNSNGYPIIKAQGKEYMMCS